MHYHNFNYHNYVTDLSHDLYKKLNHNYNRLTENRKYMTK